MVRFRYKYQSTGAALHEIAPPSAHRTNSNFVVLEGGCEGRIELPYKTSERKRLEICAVERGAYYAHKEDTV